MERDIILILLVIAAGCGIAYALWKSGDIDDDDNDGGIFGLLRLNALYLRTKRNKMKTKKIKKLAEEEFSLWLDSPIYQSENNLCHEDTVLCMIAFGKKLLKNSKRKI